MLFCERAFKIHFNMKSFRIITWAGLLLAAGLAAFSACKRESDKAAESVTEAVLESATGKDVDVEKEGEKITIETEGTKSVIDESARSWPDDLPAGVPRIEGDIQIIRVTQTDSPELKAWSVYFEKLGKGILDDYNKELKSAGFKTMIIKMGEGGSVTGEKGNVVVTLASGDEVNVLNVHERKA